MRRTATVLLLLLISMASTAYSQFLDRLTNPSTSVRLTHPPGLGLKLTKVAFGPSSGECADQIVDGLIGAFTQSEIEVVDRAHLGEILAEHDFNLSNYVDQASAVAMGKILGPSALIFIKTPRCSTERDTFQKTVSQYDYKTKTRYNVQLYSARTRAFLKISIQTIDLATGRIFSARTLDYAPEQTKELYQGYPEAPSSFDVLDKGIRLAVFEARKMFLPWTETTELVYYNDNECGLKVAFEQMSARDFKGALSTSIKNLELCKTNLKMKEKVLAHAYYNVGMGYILQNDHDQAMEYFQEAAKLRPGDIVNKAMSDCQRAKALLTEMQTIEERAAVAAETLHEQQAQSELEQASNTLTNDDVIKMMQAKLSDAIILRKITTSKCKFDTSNDGLARLQSAGVSEPVILKMMDPQGTHQ